MPRPSEGSTSIPCRSARSRSPPAWPPARPSPYQTSVTLPATPIPNVSSTGGTVHISAWVNPGETIPESNYRNDRDLGPPHDSAGLYIEAPKPADLVGTTFAVTPTDPTWGSTITVTAQITNQGSGSSPQTTALLSLTPQGLNYGDSTTVGIGTITIPPLGPYQTYQPRPDHQPARGRTPGDLQLHQLRAHDDPGLELPHQRPLSEFADPGGRLRPDLDDDHDQHHLNGHDGLAPRSGRLVHHGPDRHDPVGTGGPGQHRRAEHRPGRRRAVPGVLPPDRPGGVDQRCDLSGPDHDLRAGRRRLATGQPDLDLADAPALGRRPQQRRLRPDRRDRGPGKLDQRDAQEQQPIDLGALHRPPARQRHHRADQPGGRALPSVASSAAKDQAAVNAAQAAKAAAKLDAIVAARRAKHPRVAKPAKKLHRTHAARDR